MSPADNIAENVISRCITALPLGIAEDVTERYLVKEGNQDVAWDVAAALLCRSGHYGQVCQSTFHMHVFVICGSDVLTS